MVPPLHFTMFSLIHGDFHPGNILKTIGGNIIIDLEHATYGPEAYDLARPLQRVCKSPSQRTEYLHAYGTTLEAEELRMGTIVLEIMRTYARFSSGHAVEGNQSLDRLLNNIKKNVPV